MKVGDRVLVLRKNRVVMAGVLVRFEDDDSIGNPEEFCTVLDDSGEARAFRRSCAWDGLDLPWTARARSWRHGSVRIVPEPAPKGEKP